MSPVHRRSHSAHSRPQAPPPSGPPFEDDRQMSRPPPDRRPQREVNFFVVFFNLEKSHSLKRGFFAHFGRSSFAHSNVRSREAVVIFVIPHISALPSAILSIALFCFFAIFFLCARLFGSLSIFFL